MHQSFRIISFFDNESSGGLWGLYKIFHPKALPTGADVVESHAVGANVDIYFIDSGINANHIEFKNNPFCANPISTIFTGSAITDEKDYIGHGTHIASIIAGKSRGVAPGANIFSLKIFETVLTTTPDILIAALDRIVEHIHNKVVKNPSIVHMSLSLKKSAQVEERVKKLTDMGVLCVAAAAYENDNHVELSPAGMDEVITVSAYDKNMNVAAIEIDGISFKQTVTSYSGDKKVDIFAPGLDIEGASPSNNDKYILRSGPSVAAGFVTGVAACFLEKNPTAKPLEVKNYLINKAQCGLLNLAENKNNRVLFNVFQDMSPVWKCAGNSFLGVFYWGQEVNLQIEAESRMSEPLIFKIEQGALPEGLQISENGLITGQIVDKCNKDSQVSTSEYYSVVLKAKDLAGESEQLFYFVVTTKDLVNSPDFEQLNLVKASGISVSASCS